ncbi:VWA domain-containing protein [Pseudoalteromonas denitrificans]|uniref:von Willebrand factor type A domain-containing protein n=1 Tax=Pseudoalteromonas denitrificans DSM 6059 TaxID=1123010 RepID=A0A1I1FQ72_9GAMM|nr:VWA domain-containing protein [Pseudoalteromonas denitrificans]SFB99130.1 von Willebrand factor type A domain-containing protein [Pseudoalteromonas denitrificans DSM 6059]
MNKKRQFTTFSLSFLDIMSCGFGAVILVFLIIKHDVDTIIETQNITLQAEVNLLEEEVIEGEKHLVKIKNTISALDQDIVQTNGLARRINDEIDAVDNKITKLDDPDDDQQILQLKQKIKTLMLEKEKLEDEQAKGNDAREYSGQGNRQYLTGLQLGGARTLVLLDTSASMLDNTIVNIIRKKYMPNDIKKSSSKWIRAVSAVEWLIAKFPVQSQYQIYHFNNEVSASIKKTTHQWLAISDQESLNSSVKNLRKIIPEGGTNLEKAFRSVSFLDPLPDNILLLTDGLPTLGNTSKSVKATANTITGPQREALFEKAVNTLPEGIPVNVLLWPMEGDPMAASAFWQLAQYTSGSFMSPSKDWP